MISTEQKATSPDVRGAVVAGICLLFFSLSAFLWLISQGTASWSDEGGYRNMLFSALTTGKVDYMYWCQPTFWGMLPFLVPWLCTFGHSVLSLDYYIVSNSLSLVVVYFLLLRRVTSMTVSILLTSTLFCFTDFVATSVCFMTDIPSLNYGVCFLFAADMFFSEPKESNRWWLWLDLLGISYFLAVGTRSTYCLFLVLILLACLLKTTAQKRLVQAGLVCIGMTALSFATTALLGVDQIPFKQMTVLSRVIETRELSLIDLRTTAASTLQLLVLLTPCAFLMPLDVIRHRRIAIFVFLIASGASAYFQLRGFMFDFGHVWLSRALSVTAAVLAGATSAILLCRCLEMIRAREFSLTRSIAFGFGLTNLAIMPIMQHPLLRHALPSFVCITYALSNSKVKPGKLRLACVYGATLIIAVANTIGIGEQKRINETKWQASNSLLSQGVPRSEIDGGWSWFCSEYMVPGKFPENYVQNFKLLEQSAKFKVTENEKTSQSWSIQQRIQVPNSSHHILVESRP